MSPRTVRAVVLVVCAGGIAGMIVTSIADDGAGALSFGLITAVAALALILVTSVTVPGVTLDDDELAERVEAPAVELWRRRGRGGGAPVVGDAVRVGRRTAGR